MDCLGKSNRKRVEFRIREGVCRSKSRLPINEGVFVAAGIQDIVHYWPVICDLNRHENILPLNKTRRFQSLTPQEITRRT
jgi:hypothetical protein